MSVSQDVDSLLLLGKVTVWRSNAQNFEIEDEKSVDLIVDGKYARYLVDFEDESVISMAIYKMKEEANGREVPPA